MFSPIFSLNHHKSPMFLGGNPQFFVVTSGDLRRRQVYSQLRQADWQHRPAPQPALLCDWGLYVGGLNEPWSHGQRWENPP